ncbi:MAG: hypothetical protein AAF495_16675 [Pseudomonadota bacterium]
MEPKSKIRPRLVAFSLAFSGLIAAGAPEAAAAPDHCADREEVLRRLSEKYAEAPVARGLSLDGRMVEVLTSADGTSWSIVVSSPGKESCIALAGEGWRGLAKGKARLVNSP